MIHVIVLSLTLVSPETILKKMMSIKSLKAHFHQEIIDRTIGVVERKEGVLFFKRPFKMRWDYRNSQLFVTQEKVYFIEGDKIYIYPITHSISNNVILSLLSGSLEHFKVLSSRRNRFVLKPLFEGVDRVEVEVKMKGDISYISSVEIVTGPGLIFKLNFDRVKFMSIPDEVFKFRMPKTKIFMGGLQD